MTNIPGAGPYVTIKREFRGKKTALEGMSICGVTDPRTLEALRESAVMAGRDLFAPGELPPGQIHTEDTEQTCFVNYVTAIHPNISFFAVPNGGKREKREASRFKVAGVKAGVPDLVIPEPRGRYHGLFIEMKRTKKYKVSDDQYIWHDLLRAKGYAVFVAPGYDAAVEALEKYLKG